MPCAGRRLASAWCSRRRISVAAAAGPGPAVVRAFRAAGWEWGGRWDGARDYQHFSANAR
jgi:D-alanyl-D-alanine carboxypeptidase